MMVENVLLKRITLQKVVVCLSNNPPIYLKITSKYNLFLSLG